MLPLSSGIAPAPPASQLQSAPVWPRMPKSKDYVNQEQSIAEDFRRQLQERCRDPNLNVVSSSDEEFAWINENKQFDAVLSSIELPKSEYVNNLREQDLPNPHDTPSERNMLKRLFGLVEREISTPRGNVAYGVLRESGIEASQQQVPLTDASVINIHLPLLTFCSQISKAIALTLPYEKDNDGAKVIFDLQKIGRNLETNRDLQLYWAKIITSYAQFGKPVGIPRVLLKRDEIGVTRSLIMQAMELFAVGHEYGHHLGAHSLGGVAGAEGVFGADLHGQEHEADMISALLSIRIGARTDVRNLYAHSGVGATLILGTRDLVRRAARTIETGDDQLPPSVTHPTIEQRLTKLEEFWLAHGRPQYKSLREVFRMLLSIIWHWLRPMCAKMYAQRTAAASQG
jgi:hypothetical protein